MAEQIYLTKPEIIILVGDMLNKHETEIADPKHKQNTTLLKELTTSMNKFELTLLEIKTTFNILMKFGAGGIVIWALRQAVEIVQTLKH